MPKSPKPMRLLTMVLLLCIMRFAAVAQINVSVQIIPPYHYRVTDYASHPEQVIITVSNTSAQTQRVQLLGTVTNNANFTAQMKTGYRSRSPLVLDPGQVKLLNGNDLATIFDYNQLVYTGGMSTDQILRNGGLPEGDYNLCIRAYNYDTGASLSGAIPVGCSNTFTITSLEPPTLIVPANGAQFSAGAPQVFVISWSTPPGAPPSTQYRLRIAEVLGNRSPNDALASQTQPYFFDKTVFGNSYVYNPADPQLTPGRTYAMMVQATDPDNAAVFRNNGQSVVTSFSCLAPNTLADNSLGTSNQIGISVALPWYLRQTESGAYTGSYLKESSRLGYYKTKPIQLMAHQVTYKVTGKLDALYKVDPSKWRAALTGLKPVQSSVSEIQVASFTTTKDLGQVKNLLVDNPATLEYNRVASLLASVNAQSVTTISTYDFYLSFTDPDFTFANAIPQYPISPNQTTLDFGGDNHLLANTLRFAPKLVNDQNIAIPLSSARVTLYKALDFFKSNPVYTAEGNLGYTTDPAKPDGANDTTINNVVYRKIAEMVNVDGSYFVPGLFYNDSDDNYLAVIKASNYQNLYTNINFARATGTATSAPVITQTFKLYPVWDAKNLVLTNTKINISATFKWMMRQSEIAPYTGSYLDMNTKSSGYYNSRTVKLMAQKITYKVTGHFDALYHDPAKWLTALTSLNPTQISKDTILVASLGTLAAIGQIDNAEVDNLASIEYNRVAALLTNVNDKSETTISTYNYYFTFADPDFTPGKAVPVAAILPNQPVKDFGGVNVLMANTFRFVPKLVDETNTTVPLSSANVTLYRSLDFFANNPAYIGQGNLSYLSDPAKAASTDTIVNGTAYRKIATMIGIDGSYFIPGLFYNNPTDNYLALIKVDQYQKVCTNLSFAMPGGTITSSYVISKTFKMVHSTPVFTGHITRGSAVVADAVIWFAPTGVTTGGLTSQYMYHTTTNASGDFSISLNKFVPNPSPVVFRVYDVANDERPDGDYATSIAISRYDFNNTNSPLKIALPVLVTVQGHVRDSVSGGLIPYPIAHWKRSSQNLIVQTTDTTDHSLFSDKVPPRIDTLVVAANGYTTRSIPVNIRANANLSSLKCNLMPVMYKVTIHTQGSDGGIGAIPMTVVIGNETINKTTDSKGNLVLSVRTNTMITYSAQESSAYFSASGSSYITGNVTINLIRTKCIFLVGIFYDEQSNRITNGTLNAVQQGTNFFTSAPTDQVGYSRTKLPSNSPTPIQITATADGYLTQTLQFDSAKYYNPASHLESIEFHLKHLSKGIVKLVGLPVKVSNCVESYTSSGYVYTITGSFVNIPSNNVFSIDPQLKLDFQSVQVTIDNLGQAQPISGQTVNIITQSVPVTVFGYLPATLCGLNNKGISINNGIITGAVKVDYSHMPLNSQLNLSGDLYLTTNPANAASASAISVLSGLTSINNNSYYLCGGEASLSGSTGLSLSVAGFSGSIVYSSSKVTQSGFAFYSKFDLSGATNNTIAGKSTLYATIVVDNNDHLDNNIIPDAVNSSIYLSSNILKLVPKALSFDNNGFNVIVGSLSVLDGVNSPNNIVSFNFNNLLISPNNISGASFKVIYGGGNAFNVVYQLVNYTPQNSNWQFGKDGSGNYYLTNSAGTLTGITKPINIDVSGFSLRTEGTSVNTIKFAVNQNNVVIHYGKLADFNATALLFDQANKLINLPGQFQINSAIPIPMNSCTLSLSASSTPDQVIMPGNNFKQMGGIANVAIDWKFVSSADSVYFVGDGVYNLQDKIIAGIHALLVGLPDQSDPKFYGSFQVNSKSSIGSKCNGCIILATTGYKLYNYYGSFKYTNSDDWNMHLGGDITDIANATNTITHADLNFNSADVLTGTSNTKFYDPARLINYANVDGYINIDFNNQIATVQISGQRDLIPNIATSSGYGQINFYFKESCITGFFMSNLSRSLFNLYANGTTNLCLLGINANLNTHSGDYGAWGLATVYLTDPRYGGNYLVQGGIFNGVLLTAANKVTKSLDISIPYFTSINVDNTVTTFATLSTPFANKTLKVSLSFSDNITGSVRAGPLSLNIDETVSGISSGSLAIDNPASINYSGSAGVNINSCAGDCDGSCGNGPGVNWKSWGIIPYPAPYVKVCIGKTVTVNCGTSGAPTVSIN